MRICSAALLLLILFFQTNYSFADESFCSLFSLSPEYEVTNELNDCQIKLDDIKSEMTNLKKQVSITSLDKIRNTSYDGSNQLVSCEKELIDKIQELEDLREYSSSEENQISAN